MIIKYFSSGASSSGAVEYIEKNETAKTLKGNNNLTRRLIKNNTNKLKYRSGVISFGTDRPNKKQVMEIIELFEESTFAGLEKDQYNSLWVEHNDKDNYHIHFVIPRLELSTMKAFNPHYHKADQKRLMKMQDYINRKYHLINPFDTDRRQTLELNTNWTSRNKAKETIDQIVTTAISQEIISSRQELVSFLEENGLQVKISKNYIAIKSEKDKKYIRLKGAYYNENFTSREELAEELARTEREHRTDTYGELVEAREELDRLIQFKANKIGEQYPKERKNFDFDVTGSADIQSDTSGLYADTKQDNHLERQRTGVDTKNDDKQRIERSIHIHGERKAILERQRIKNLYKSEKLSNDSTGTTATRSITGSTEQEHELISNSSTARERIHEQYARDCERLQANIEATTTDTYTRIESYNARANSTQSASVERIKGTSSTKSSFARAFGEFARAFGDFIKQAMTKPRRQGQGRSMSR